MKLTFILILLIISNTYICQGQTFLNGSFENTTSPNSCNFNIDNTTYNSLMSNSSAFGAFQELDIIIANCFVPTIPDGTYSLSMSNNSSNLSQSEAISLELSSALVSGNTYTITFQGYGINQGDILIGCSESNIAFGDQIYVATTVNSQWTSFSFSFTAPNNGLYITVMPSAGVNSYNSIDDFSITTNLSIQKNDIKSLNIFPNPTSNFIQISNLKTNSNYCIYNTLGQPILNGSINNQDEKINIQKIPTGVYILKLDDKTTFPFVKE